MSMDNYNPDLIFDLAAGNLPEAEARAAEASLSAEGRAELQAQRAVLAVIAEAPPATMTDIERARLHRSVISAIAETTRELSPVAVAAAPVAPPTKPRSRMLFRWASAAAAAAMLVGVVAVGSQLGALGGSGDSADTIAVSEIAAATSTTAAGAGNAALSGDSGNDSFPPSAGEGSDGGLDGGGAVTEDSLGFADELLEAPTLRDTQDRADLAEVAAWLVEARRLELDPIDDIGALPCYEVAVEDDDLDIADGFLLDYINAAGETLQGIAYADQGTDTVEPLIRVYDFFSCEPVVASTD